MNIIFDITKFNLACIYFLESKRNIIMEGIFSKILYSNQYFTMNGIYLHLPLEIQYIEKSINKSMLKFYPSCSTNYQLVQDLSKIEYKLLEYYKQMNNIVDKKNNYILTKQLYSGNLKLYKDFNDMKNINDKNYSFIVKVSGIWETNEEIGITYKVMESFSIM